ncbi:ferredoxin [Actinotalea sp. M2MS4P-6]|uniref:ferredoxin n=1 Tax=Actinotalea sp. M2MS4P-6 TaxID=2983762 RepID=UPI0021E50CF1|nr:ferredoxin [Actinotalea sp. M2MS4P-6]MCV2393081.1 ferredoxin [Actinotalea sp. M2MS4P-6]
MSRAPAVTMRLRVDPVACEGVGLCAQVAGRVVELDRWGYPVIEAELDARGVKAAQRAVRACPRRAMWLEEADTLR